MMAKATPNAINDTTWGDSTPTEAKADASNVATNGSPSQPSPKLAKVMPNCVADK